MCLVCLQHNNILEEKEVDHMLRQEKNQVNITSVTSSMKYIMISRNKDLLTTSVKHVYKDSCSLLTYL